MAAQKPRTFVLQTEDQLAEKLYQELVRCAKQALVKSKAFRIGLSGGSIVQLLTKALKTGTDQLDIARWVFFFCDERYVAHDHNDSTYYAYKNQMLDKIPQISDSQFIKADTSKSLDDCAIHYEKCLKTEFECSLPTFDLLLLGMGPDGHTCSLFPEQAAALAESQRLVIPIRDSPKPPPERITFTFPLINNATDIIFVLTGASKADVVKRAFVEFDKTLPAALVKPKHGQLTFIMDTGAGQPFMA